MTTSSTRYNRTGYTDEFRARHAAEQAQREAERQELARQNEALRQQRLAAIAAERAAKIKEHEAAIEQELSGRKEVERRSWLIAHPDKTAADFERVWPLVRSNLLADREEQVRSQSVERLRASGEYRL